MTEFNFDTSYYFSSLHNINEECKNYTDSEIKYKELITKYENEIYQKGYKQGLKEAFNKLECEEFDTCLRIEYEKSKVYEKALDDVRNLTFREVTYTDSLNDRTELRELIDELKKD